jgi:hypothetical protein
MKTEVKKLPVRSNIPAKAPSKIRHKVYQLVTGAETSTTLNYILIEVKAQSKLS